MFGKGMVKTDEMNAHKVMAGAQMSGTFGVRPMPGQGPAKPKSRGDGYNRDGKL